ncbi:MAG: hypothetical protein IJ438_10880 [Clostridia bacterium]|nr:hypothetical protein [Clostridia bacterium]
MSSEINMEKVSVNMNVSTLSQIDLLVDGGYYSNRSDFINQAVREALRQQQGVIDHLVDRHERRAGGENNWFIGIYGITAKDVEEMYQQGAHESLTGYGVLHIAADCDEEKLFAAVERISVRGKVHASASIKAHYGIR